MLTPSAIKTALQEYAGTQVAKLRGSAGSSSVYASVMATLPQMQACADFLSRCRVIGATLALHAGDFPVVRVRLRSGRQTRTVTPSRWLADLIGSFGEQEFEDFALHLKKAVPKERIQTLEVSMNQEAQKLLGNSDLVDGMRKKLDRKKVMERDRQIKAVVTTFRNVPHDLLTEEDVIRLWRENQVRHVLES